MQAASEARPPRSTQRFRGLPRPSAARRRTADHGVHGCHEWDLAAVSDSRASGIEIATEATAAAVRGDAARSATIGRGGRGAPEGDRAYPMPGGTRTRLSFRANPPPEQKRSHESRTCSRQLATRDRTRLAKRVTRVLARLSGQANQAWCAPRGSLTAEEAAGSRGHALYTARAG